MEPDKKEDTLRILIVEDSKHDMIAFRRAFKESQVLCAITEYARAEEALDIIQTGENLFDVIITDYKLPGMSGLQLCKELLARKTNLPLVLFTGVGSEQVAVEALKAGVYDYIIKDNTAGYLKLLPLTIEGVVSKHKDKLRRIEAEKQIKVALKENRKYKENLQAVFKSIRDAIITVDRELRILDFNDAAKKACGFSEISISKGKKYESFLHGCNGECLATLTETIRTKLPTERKRFECSNNNMPRCVVSAFTYPLLDIQGQFNGCVMVLKDETRLAELESDLHDRQQFHNIIGKSKSFDRIFSLIEVLADAPTTVLITGENGTGKGLIANALHYHKKNVTSPFVVVGCATLSDNVLESELFGHVKGAFTGAVNDRVGRFQKADGGTIFLDEIGDISTTMQLRLLRVLEERVIERVGDSAPIKVNARIVAATNQDLREKVRQGVFREDLYHRLKVMELTVPPLRERREDIPLLVTHFIERLNKRLNKEIKSISANVQQKFMEYGWPGNVRELSNTMESAFIICEQKVITIENLSSDIRETGSSDKRTIEKHASKDRQSIIEALEKTDWNKSKAARLLDMHRATIYKMIKKFAIRERECE